MRQTSLVSRQAISTRLNINPAVLSQLVKELLAEYLPENLVYRKKEGFSFSLKDYLDREIKEDFAECLGYYRKNPLNFGLNEKLIKSLASSGNFREIIFKKYPRFVFGLISNYKFLKNTKIL